MRVEMAARWPATGTGGGAATQLPLTLPAPVMRKSALATQPAMITTWFGVPLPSVTFNGVPPPFGSV